MSEPDLRRHDPSRPPSRGRRPSALLPPPQVLPLLRPERAEDRLQGRAPAVPLPVGARQDRAEPHHGRSARRSSVSWPTPSSAPASWPCCPTSSTTRQTGRAGTPGRRSMGAVTALRPQGQGQAVARTARRPRPAGRGGGRARRGRPGALGHARPAARHRAVLAGQLPDLRRRPRLRPGRRCAWPGCCGLLLVGWSGGGFAGADLPGAVRGAGAAAGGGGAAPGRLALSLPLALLGLWPLLCCWWPPPSSRMTAGWKRRCGRPWTASLTRLGIPAPEEFVAALVRVKAGAIGFWAAVSAAGQCGGGGGLPGQARPAGGAAARLGRRCGCRAGIRCCRRPRSGCSWRCRRTATSLALSALLLLLVPLFLQGVAGVHTRLRGRKGRRPMLAGFYLLLVLFLQVMGPGLVALGLYDQFLRRPAPRQS